MGEKFEVTKTWLARKGACVMSVKALGRSGLLPVTISTDPGENLRVVLKLERMADSYGNVSCPCCGWMYWLRKVVIDQPTGKYLGDVDDVIAERGRCVAHNQNYVMVMQQVLAWIADAVLHPRRKSHG